LGSKSSQQSRKDDLDQLVLEFTALGLSDVSRPTVDPRRAVRLALHRVLGSAAAVLGVIYLMLSVNYAVFFPTGAATVVSRLGLLSTAAMLALYFWANRGKIPAERVELACLFVGTVAIANAAMPMYYLPEPKYTLNFSLLVFGFGAVGLPLRLFVPLSIAAVSAWGFVAHPYFSIDWIPHTGVLAGAAVFSALLHRHRIRTVILNEHLRAENEWRGRMLTTAIRALQLSQERFRRLSEAAFEAIAIHEAGEILDANQAFAQMFRYKLERVLGRSIRKFISCTDRRVLDALFRGVSKPLEAQGIRSDGTVFPIEIRVKPIPYQNRRARVVAIRDTSEYKRTERELIRAKEAAEKASEMKSRWLANVSHELRTPLNSIIGFSEMLASESFGPLNEKQKRYVENILSSGRHLLQMINDLLDLSKIEAGRMKLEITRFDPRAAIQNVVDSLMPLAFKKHIEIRTELDACPQSLEADPAKFRQILYNLLSNAIKFTPERGKITVRAEVESRSGDAYYTDPLLLVSVQDTGIGIRPEDQEKIFNEFEQVANGQQGQQKGTGLGLPLAKKLVELHGGTIWVESEGLNKGSTFSFVIPLRQSVRRKGGSSQKSRAVLPAPRARLRRRISERPLILVIDDDPESRELLYDGLEPGGYEVITAATAREGLQLAQNHQPDVVLLDLYFARQEKGWDLLSKLKADPRTADIPVVIVTVAEDKQEVAFNLGAVEYFVKPVDIRALLRRLAYLTADRDGTRGKVLVAGHDDEALVHLLENLNQAGFSVIRARDGMQALQFAHRERPNVIVLSLSMPKVNTKDVVKYLKKYRETAAIPIFVLKDRELDARRERELRQYAQLADASAICDYLRTAHPSDTRQPQAEPA